MLFKVKVFPCSRKDKIIKKSEDSFEIKIKEKPIQGKANKAVVGLLSDYFKIPEEKIRPLKGSRQRNKIFEIKD